VTDHDDMAGIAALLRSPRFAEWRTQVEATRGCAAPVHLRGSSQVINQDGRVLVERAGTVLAPCGNRRESVCPSCSDRYAADAFHLLRAGLAGDDGKGVPVTVSDRPRAFVTLTAPSFGAVHTRRISPRGLVVPCPCGERHHADDPRPGTALDPDTYDYTGAVLWQAHSGKLWNRFTIALRRALAGYLGVTAASFRDHARLSYAKVAEYQRRGLVHFHAVIRLDGPEGAADPCPPALTADVLHSAITAAARAVSVPVVRPDGTAMALGWGKQLDVRPVTAAAARQIEDESGAITDSALAGYIAKYATKGTGATEGADRPIRSGDHIAHLDVSPHHRAMIATAWQLGGLVAYEDLNLRRWAHMLGFRGHFLTKSQRYSTTFGAIRTERRTWRLGESLAQLGRDATDQNDRAPDPSTVTVVNHWVPVHFGHHSDAERELAGAIAARHQQRRTTSSTTDTRSAA
jgi:hypothetical protein